MRSTVQRLLATGVALGVATAVATFAVASPAAAASPCGWRPANNSNLAAEFNAAGVNIRSGGDLGCTILGSGYPGQSVSARCVWTNSGTGALWVYLTDNTTGVTGWSRSDLVTFLGSTPPHPLLC